jgi:hypothetical protein
MPNKVSLALSVKESKVSKSTKTPKKATTVASTKKRKTDTAVMNPNSLDEREAFVKQGSTTPL